MMDVRWCMETQGLGEEDKSGGDDFFLGGEMVQHSTQAACFEGLIAT